jgi:uncharacterized coiled-coil DUF342 family protein
MKKNKKYWKKQAKGWKKIAGIESESANEWAYTSYTQEEQIEELEQELYTVHMDLQIESMLLDEAKDSYAELDKQYIEAIEKAESLAASLTAVKKELSILRQYNIGNKNVTHTTDTSTTDYAKWAIKQYNIPVGMDDKAKKLIEQYNAPVEENILRWWKRKN